MDSSGANRLYIANLGEGMDADWLTKTFGQFSPVQKVFVMHDRKSKTGRYSAFVTLEDQASCQRAIDALHNSQCLDGNQYGLVVRFSEPPGTKAPQRTDVQQGGWGGGGYNNNNAGWGASSYGGGNSWGQQGGWNNQQQGGWNNQQQGGWNNNRGGGGGYNNQYQQQSQPQQQQQSAQQTQQTTSGPSATGKVIYSQGKVWYEASDPNTRKPYYYTSDGETRWDRPAEDGAGGGGKKGGKGGRRPY